MRKVRGQGVGERRKMEEWGFALGGRRWRWDWKIKKGGGECNE